MTTSNKKEDTTMKKTMTATLTAPALATAAAEVTEAPHWLTYQDVPATLNLQEFASWMMSTNPSMAMSILMGALEDHASLPSEYEEKLVEVSVFDEEGTPLYNLTPTGSGVYDQTVSE